MNNPKLANKQQAAGTARAATKARPKTTLKRTTKTALTAKKPVRRTRLSASPPPPPERDWVKKILHTIEVITLVCLRIFIEAMLIIELAEYINYKFLIPHVA